MESFITGLVFLFIMLVVITTPVQVTRVISKRKSIKK
jgi:hypothetical protein